MDNKYKDAFSYNYSANEQEEIERIRKKYIPQTEDKMEQLRRLDNSVNQKATLISLILGVLGTLIMGGGMSCVLVLDGLWLIPGVLLGVIGMVILALAYPVYMHIIKKERERIAPEVIRLTDELMR